MAAKSSSVCPMNIKIHYGKTMEEEVRTHDEGLIMIFQLSDPSTVCIVTHAFTQSPFVNSRGGVVEIFLKQCRHNELIDLSETHIYVAESRHTGS